MNKIYLALCAVALLSACTDDDSTYATRNDHFINVTGLAESYDMVSFSGDKLNISPVVETGYAPDDLSYMWTYYNKADAEKKSYDAVNNVYVYAKADTISFDKDLSWPITLIDGQYNVVLTVSSKSTGYSRQFTTSVNTSSALSQGFYILKENSEGNTDVDLYNTTSKSMVSDVIRHAQGAAIPGKPRWMDVDYQLAYADPVSGEKGSANMLCITTEDNEVRWIRALDCKTIMDGNSNHYEPVEGEIPYRTVRGNWTVYYLTSNGVYTASSGDMGGSGLFGALATTGASTHVVGGTEESNYYSIVCWNEREGSLDMVDYNGGYSPVMQGTQPVEGLNYDCIDCGLCMAGSEAMYFLFQDKADATKKYLYQISSTFTGSSVSEVRELNPDSHFAQARLRAFNGQQATIAYALDGNEVYSYNLVAEAPEKQLTFAGLPADETITFLSNRYMIDDTETFDYLVVGTQKGDSYKLYFYTMIGGEPDGEPQFTISGTGKLKSLGYLNPHVADMTPGAAMPILDE